MKDHTLSPDQPIGIFDSGIGGLTVANEIRKKLPGESLIYFGDTAHLPYGDKSAKLIRHYAEEISKFLKAKNCKTIIIACNSASAVGFERVVKTVGKDLKVFNVIDPVVDFVTRKKANKRIGVIGTKATIRAGAYKKRIKNKDEAIKVRSMATPLLAPMVEEGYFNNNISQTIINSYLSSSKISDIDALILACTHYPLIKPEVEKYYKNSVEILDCAEIVASSVEKYLRTHGLLRTKKRKTQHFFVSDYTPSFEKSTKIFFKGKIKLEKSDLWKD